MSAVATVLLIPKTFIVKYYDRRQTDSDRQIDREADRQRHRQVVRACERAYKPDTVLISTIHTL